MNAEGQGHGERSGTAERLLRIGREMSGHLQEPYKSTEHGYLLYDENGLPSADGTQVSRPPGRIRPHSQVQQC